MTRLGLLALALGAVGWFPNPSGDIQGSGSGGAATLSGSATGDINLAGYTLTDSSTANFRLQNTTLNNLEPTAAQVRFMLRLTPPTLGGSAESTGLYTRISPSGANLYAWYAELDSSQTDQHGGLLKLIHYGAGDAFYAALRNTGLGFEMASYYNGSRHFFSTNQRQGGANPQVGSDFGNTVHFGSVWGDDTTGGSTTPPNYGAFYADRSLGNSFMIRIQDPNRTGYALGRTEFKLSTYDLTRNYFELYNTGELRTYSPVATIGQQAPFGAPLRLVQSWYNAGTPQDKAVKLTNSTSSAGVTTLDIALGAVASETTAVSVSTGGLILPSANTLSFGTSATANLGYSSTNSTLTGSVGGAQVFAAKTDGSLSLGLSTGNPYGTVDRLHIRGSSSTSSKYSLYIENLATSLVMAYDNGGTLQLVGSGSRLLLPNAFSITNGVISYANAAAQGAITFPSATTGQLAFTAATGTLALNGVGFTFNKPVAIQSCAIRGGAGTPEGSVTGNVCDLYLRTDGGASTTLYIKESGASSTGWVAK